MDVNTPLNVLVLDRDFVLTAVIDEYKSFIWTERYNECCDFELVIAAASPYREYLKEDYYIMILESDRLMVIETLALQRDFEAGDFLTVKGRGIESILERRIIWGFRSLSGDFQTSIKTLLNENVISPSISARKIDKFTFVTSTDTNITSKTVAIDYFGENLLEEIMTLCKTEDVGFKVLPDYSTKKMKFSLYYGIDRSYKQTENPWVIFSEAYENLSDSTFVSSKLYYKTVCMVGGDGEDSEKDYVVVNNTKNPSGIDRREMYIEATGSSNDGTELVYPDDATDEEKETLKAEYEAAQLAKFRTHMKEEGDEALKEVENTTAFDGEASAAWQFVYGTDFDLGDIVQVVNAYGYEARARVTELMRTFDETGRTVIPSFTALDGLNDNLS